MLDMYYIRLQRSSWTEFIFLLIFIGITKISSYVFYTKSTIILAQAINLKFLKIWKLSLPKPQQLVLNVCNVLTSHI